MWNYSLGCIPYKIIYYMDRGVAVAAVHIPLRFIQKIQTRRMLFFTEWHTHTHIH